MVPQKFLLSSPASRLYDSLNQSVYLPFPHIFLRSSQTHLFSNIFNTSDACTIEVAVVFSRLYEHMILYICLHLLPRAYEMVIPSVDFVVTLWPCRVCNK